jgi:hypothetical protein
VLPPCTEDRPGVHADCLGSPGAGGGSSGESRAWAAAQEKLSNANELVHSVFLGNIPAPCQNDFNALGIGSFQIPNAINQETWNDGNTAGVSELGLFTATGDPDAFAFYSQHPNITIAQIFSNSHSTKAEAALPGSALAGNIYFDPKFVNGLSLSNAAALLVHETLHVLGLTDPVVQKDLGLTVGAASDNITQKLATDCFGQKGVH